MSATLSGTDSLLLGIETSCDETAAAVVEGGRVIHSNVIASQVDIHARFGGVVPEVASRKHAEMISAVVEQALVEAGVGWKDLAGIAVTHGPGLVGALLVGVAAAKGYALATGLPLIGVNHVEAHLLANFLRMPEEERSPALDLFPSVCLIVSGGHSDLVLVKGLGNYRILGATRDDAAGEAMDKAARVLGLGYPGGPAIDRSSREGDRTAVNFPRPVVPKTLDFSFSGLKTALLREVQSRYGNATKGGAQGIDAPTKEIADLAASFQEAVVDTLTRNLIEAAAQYGARQVMLAGGVAANSRLREKVRQWSERHGVPACFPPLRLCTDNAAMVGAAGFFGAQGRGWDSLDLDVFSAMPITERTAP
jgi:N6-L-threonylcarbamoyladenine synthase